MFYHVVFLWWTCHSPMLTFMEHRSGRWLTAVHHLHQVNDGVEGSEADAAFLVFSELHQFRKQLCPGVVHPETVTRDAVSTKRDLWVVFGFIQCLATFTRSLWQCSPADGTYTPGPQTPRPDIKNEPTAAAPSSLLHTGNTPVSARPGVTTHLSSLYRNIQDQLPGYKNLVAESNYTFH